MRRTTTLLAALALATVGAIAVPTAAIADEISVPPICHTSTEKTPGFELRVGDTYVEVPSFDDITVCLYEYAVATYGLPIPQFPDGCGTGCTYIQTDGFGGSLKPYVEVSYKADGVWTGARYDAPPVEAGVQYTICFSVGDEYRPTCDTTNLFNVEQTI